MTQNESSGARTYPTAVTGTWSDVERTAWHVYETIDRDTTDWELAEAALVLLGETKSQREENDRLADEVRRRAAENARLQDGVTGLVRAIYAVYEQAQTAMRKPSP